MIVDENYSDNDVDVDFDVDIDDDSDNDVDDTNQRSIGADEAAVVALPKTQAVRLFTIILMIMIVMMFGNTGFHQLSIVTIKTQTVIVSIVTVIVIFRGGPVSVKKQPVFEMFEMIDLGPTCCM